LDEGFVEYICKSEENNDCLIATNLNDMIKIFKVMSEDQLNNMPFTHCEIKNVLILGMCSSQTPYATFNQGPRLVYASGMVKQAMSAVYMNTVIRVDTLLHQLSYSNKRIVYTLPLNWMRAEDSTPGQTIDVAVITYGGKGQEDACSMNVGLLNRGWGRSTQSSTFTLNEKKQNNSCSSELFTKPNRLNTLKMKVQSYDHLDGDGAPFPGKR
jgi:DNA-directed RNA polymerase beta subunit